MQERRFATLLLQQVSRLPNHLEAHCHGHRVNVQHGIGLPLTPPRDSAQRKAAHVFHLLGQDYGCMAHLQHRHEVDCDQDIDVHPAAEPARQSARPETPPCSTASESVCPFFPLDFSFDFFAQLVLQVIQ